MFGVHRAGIPWNVEPGGMCWYRVGAGHRFLVNQAGQVQADTSITVSRIW